MKRLNPFAFMLVFLVGCISDYDVGADYWEDHEYKKAQEWFLKIEEGEAGYDSAQIRLAQLPDTAYAYYFAQAEEKLDAEEFEEALEACETALGFKPEKKEGLVLQKEIGSTAYTYYLSKSEKLLAEGEFTPARKACLEAMEFDSTAREAEYLFDRIEARADRERRIKERKEKERREAELLAKRKAFAKQYEYNLLDEGIEATVTVHGSNATTLKLEWILASKVIAHEYSKDQEFFQMLREMEFKKFILTDGYDFTWYWNL